MARGVDAEREPARDRESARARCCRELLGGVAADAVGLRLPTIASCGRRERVGVALDEERERRSGIEASSAG